MASLPAERAGHEATLGYQRTQSVAGMAVTGAVATYALPSGEGGSYALLRGPRGEAASGVGQDLPSRAPRIAQRVDADNTGGATILEFPDRFSSQLDDDRAYHAASNPRARQARAFATAPTGAFLAQHIAQERLGDGLTLDPHARAAAAYSRSFGLSTNGQNGRLDVAI